MVSEGAPRIVLRKRAQEERAGLTALDARHNALVEQHEAIVEEIEALDGAGPNVAAAGERRVVQVTWLRDAADLQRKKSRNTAAKVLKGIFGR